MAKPAEKPTLEETVALLEATLESTHDGILVVSLDRRLIRFNRQFVEMFRFPPDMVARRDSAEMFGFAAEQLDDPDALLFRSPRLWGDLSGEFLSVLRFKDGRVLERFVAPQRIGDTIVGRVISYRDVSQNVRTEQALEQHRAFLEKAQEVAHIGSWVAELDGSDHLGWSRETHRIFGVPLGAFDGRSTTFFAFVHADDRETVRAARQAAVDGGKPYDVVHRILAAGGDVRWVHERADVVRDEQGRPARMIGTAQDITERQQLEEQLQHAQKLDAIGRLAGGIAHDLNNALTAIAGYTELALIAMSAEHPARADVEEVRRAAERAASVTRQLLAFSRKQMLEPRLFNLNDTVATLGRMLGRLLGEDILLRTELQPALPSMHADPGQIEQTIINLALNARDAMPGGGDLVLATSITIAREGSPHPAMPAGPYVTLSVSDTGHGMTSDIQTHVFEPFFTTKAVGKGTGLGLAMVYGTVKQSGGYIFVESEPGRGTTFRLFFPPAAMPDTAAGLEAGHGATTPTEAALILVVEDEETVRTLVTATLEQEGYRVMPAASAEEAVALAADVGAVDLLLTDAKMPGVSGIALAKLLLAARPGLPVIVMSGFTEELTVAGAMSGSVGILHKPFTPSELRQRIRSALARRELRRGQA